MLLLLISNVGLFIVDHIHFQVFNINIQDLLDKICFGLVDLRGHQILSEQIKKVMT